jgi:WRKY DNA -binding domain
MNLVHFRSYFRCTYRDDRHCAATKQVQQKDFTDPPVYEVTYKNSHSCNSTPMVEAKHSIQSNSSKKRSSSFSFDFSKGSVYLDEHYPDSDSKLCQINLDADSTIRFHDTENKFTPVGSRNFDSCETDLPYRNSLSDCSTLQGFGELDGLDDFDIVEYVNSSDVNSG